MTRSLLAHVSFIFLLVAGLRPSAAAQDLDLGRIPVGFFELSIHTCDAQYAESGDPVEVVFQDRDTQLTYKLDNPGSDRRRNTTDTYAFGGFGKLSDLRAITLRKPGNDGWCIDSVRLTVNDTSFTVIGWSKGDPVVTDDGLAYVGPFPSTTGPVWLDGDGVSTQLRFSEAKTVKTTARNGISYPNQPNGPLMMAVYSCTDDWAGSADKATLTWKHDGIVEKFVIDRVPAPGGVGVYIIDSTQVVDTIEWMQFSKGGTDAWCISKILVHNLWGTYLSLDQRYTLDREADDPTVVWRFLNEKRNTWRGTPTAYSHPDLPLTRGGDYPSLTSFVNVFNKTNWSVCSPPTTLYHGNLEHLIATEVVQAWGSKGKWGDGYVKVTRVDNNSVHVRVRFEQSVDGIAPNITIFIDFDVDASCQYKLVRVDDGGVFSIPRYEYAGAGLSFVATNMVTDVDVKWIHLLGATLLPSVRERLVKGIEKLRSLEIDPVDAEVAFCPVISTTTSGTFNFNWSTALPENVLCKP